MKHPKTGTARTAQMQILSLWGIKNPKTWLLNHVESAIYTTNYAGQKPVEIEYKGHKKYFANYAEAAVYYYKELNGLNQDEIKFHVPNSRVNSKIQRLEKLLMDDTIPANEKEEIKQKIEELSTNL